MKKKKENISAEEVDNELLDCLFDITNALTGAPKVKKGVQKYEKKESQEKRTTATGQTAG